MAVIEIDKDPSPKTLLTFGALLAPFFGLVGAIALWRFGAPTVAGVLWAMGAVLGLVFFLVPSSRKPLYLGWIHLFYPLGWLISHVVLGIVYYLVLAPIGLVMRLFGRDLLHRRFDPVANTYWVKRPPAPGPERYFRQF